MRGAGDGEERAAAGGAAQDARRGAPRAVVHRRRAAGGFPQAAGVSRGSAGAGAAGMRRGRGRAGAALLAVAVAAVAVVACVVGLSGLAGQGGATSPTDAGAPAGEQAAFPQEPSGKLAGATETVDANGVVHGTTPEGVNYLLWGRGQAADAPEKVSLVAAGDAIGTDQVLALADVAGGAAGDGAYDFSGFYGDIAPFVQKYDLRFVNQETVMAGTDEYGYSGYPSFNTPDEAAGALAGAGFNLVNLATNHVLDYGVGAAERSLGVWDAYPGVACAGSYRSQADRETVRLVERNGMTFAFLAFCYGDNYYQEDLPDTWHLCGFDKEAIEADVRRAQQVADAVIVAMHWGTEYESEPDGQQLEYAAFLADLDVDLVLGTHAHVIQPVRYVEGASGNAVPVVFGLGDLVSGWGKADFVLSGLFTCDFVRVYEGAGDALAGDGGAVAAGDAGAEGDGGEGGASEAGGAAAAGDAGAGSAAGGETARSADAAAAEGAAWHVEVRNLAWHPVVEWSDGGPVRVRFVAGMDEATTNANVRISGLNYAQPSLEGTSLYAYLREKTNATITDIPVAW